jgi:selenocysteine-specific elongation factor
VALVRELEATGEHVRVAPDVAFTAAALDDAVARLRAAYEREGPLTAARAKQVLGTSRKYALPLLETLDRLGRTRRRGDVRDVLA